jgi:hypothetical protein
MSASAVRRFRRRPPARRPVSMAPRS